MDWRVINLFSRSCQRRQKSRRLRWILDVAEKRLDPQTTGRGLYTRFQEFLLV